MTFVTRFAIDDRGRLGSFYDIRRDCVLGQGNVRNNHTQAEIRNSFTYKIDKCDSKKKVNLLDFLDVEKELQLSLVLNLSMKTSQICSMIGYNNNVIHPTTRILTFRYVNDEQLFVNNNEISLPFVESTATHFITSISWGFYAIVIVQLPNEEETIDCILRKLCETSAVDDNDKDSLKRVTIEKIYSNVYDLTILTDLFTICQRMIQLRNNVVSYPMTYTLQPLSTLLTNTGEQTAAFMNPSFPFTSILLNQILNIVRTTANIEVLFNSYTVKEQFFDMYQKWLDLKKRYTHEIERISKHLISCRSDEQGLLELKHALDDPNVKLLQKDLHEFEKKLNARPSIDEEIEITIVLLGETGVGKSTFINALVNYLNYESFEIAESKQPIILIPISFIMTAGEQFQEYTITLENTFQSYDENFNLFGQSVTQHCRSYMLQLKNNPRKKIRLVDTPGFGDTRGSTQDDRNMQHILEYINSLPHINAICYLFKPNETNINPFFRSSITQILNQLGPDASINFIFCFTNTRATFFTPGDTASSLKTILSSLTNSTVQFKKENTFCFDSESFRYLAALQQSVPIEAVDRREYEHSWIVSVKESNRFLDYICKNLSEYRTDEKQRLIKNIQFEIIHTIRPISEAIRNILRNMILKNSKQSIELHPKPFVRLATQCQSCNPVPIQCGPFSILPDMGHEIQDKCLTCSCTLDQHIPMEYMLDYKYVANVSDNNAWSTMIEPLFIASIEFAYFLTEATQYTKYDPFYQSFNRLINEERNIIEKVQINQCNLQLLDQLKGIRDEYQNRMQQRKQQGWNGDLSSIKQHIETVNNYPIVREQIVVIKESQARLMHIFEYSC